MSSYNSMLRDARWQRKRLEIMERDDFTCRSCGMSDKDEGTTLNVHHAYYEKGKKPWEYDDEILETLCDECHKEKHYRMRCISKFCVGKNVRFLDFLSFIAGSKDVEEAIKEASIIPSKLIAQVIVTANQCYKQGAEESDA